LSSQSGFAIEDWLAVKAGIGFSGQFGLVFDLVNDKFMSKDSVSFMKVEIPYNLPLLLRRLPKKAQQG